MNKTLARLNISILEDEKYKLVAAIESCKGNPIYEDGKHINKLSKKINDIDKIVEYLKETFL